MGGLAGQCPEPGLFARPFAVLWGGIGVWRPAVDPCHPGGSHHHEYLEHCLFDLGSDRMGAEILVTRRPALLFADRVGIGSFRPVCRLLEHAGLEILMDSLSLIDTLGRI